MVKKSIRLVGDSLRAESKRLGKTKVKAALDDFSRRVNEIAARSKQQILKEELARDGGRSAAAAQAEATATSRSGGRNTDPGETTPTSLGSETPRELDPTLVNALEAGLRYAADAVHMAGNTIGWDVLTEGLERLQSDMSAIENAVEDAVPLTSPSGEGLQQLILRFSTDPKGLGLSAQQFWTMMPYEWLDRYREWERARNSRILAKQRSLSGGKSGRPPKDQTGKIHAEWTRIGKPHRTAAVLDRIADAFFADELKGILRGSPQHRKVRERVRQALQRCEKRTAT
jgi:hypothetical protein